MDFCRRLWSFRTDFGLLHDDIVCHLVVKNGSDHLEGWALPFYYACWLSSAARMNSRINGCGRVGRDANSGWNCVPMKKG